jgi:hypothetical protein
MVDPCGRGKSPQSIDSSRAFRKTRGVPAWRKSMIGNFATGLMHILDVFAVCRHVQARIQPVAVREYALRDSDIIFDKRFL